MIKNHLYRASRLAIVFLTGILGVACGEEKPEPGPEIKPEITIDASCLDVFSSGIHVEAEPAGGSFTKDVLFSTTDKWTATLTGGGATGWVSIRPTSGAAGKIVMTVTVSKNDTESERRAEVKITCGTVNKVFTVIQAGKTPPVDNTPAIFNLTDSNSSGASIVSYDYQEGTLILEMPEEKLPKVGDIVCSGVTEQAPYGFLFQVREIERISTRVMGVRTKVIGASLSLYAVCNLLGIESAEWYTLKEVKTEVECATDEGQSVKLIRDGDTDAALFNLAIHPNKDVTLSFELHFAVSQLRFYLDTTTPDIVTGFDAKTRATIGSHLTLNGEVNILKGDIFKERSLVDPTVIKSYEFTIGGIPFVVTTKYKPTAPYKLSMKGKVDMDLFHKTFYPHIGATWRPVRHQFDIVEGAPGYIYMEDPEDVTMEYPSQDFSLTLNGTASFGIDFEYSIGLYGGNVFDESIEILQEAFALDPNYKVSAKYLSIGVNGGLILKNEATIGAMTNLAEDSHNAIRVIDDNKFTSNLYGKLWGTLFKWERINENDDKDGYKLEVLSGEKEVKLLKTEYHFPFFFPSYTKLKINGITHQDFINISGRRHKPAIRIFNEVGYGFCLESADGTEYYTYDATSHPTDSKTHVLSFDIPLQTAKLRRNVKYSIYPYSIISNFPFSSGERMVCREGVGFVISDDGQLTTSVIDDVPGVVL